MSLMRRAAAPERHRHLELVKDLEEKLDLKDGDLGWDDERGWALLTGQRGSAPRTFIELTMSGLRKNPVVSGCLRTITNAITDAALIVEVPVGSPDDNEWERAPLSHGAQVLINNPNPRDPGVAFIERSVAHYLLGGNTLLKKIRQNSRRIDRLIPVRPDRILSALTDEDDLPVAFKLSRGDTSQVEVLLANDVVLIPDIDPLNEIFGMPRLLSASLEIATDNEASDYVSEVLTNHGNPGMVIGTDPTRAKSNLLEQAEEKWMEKFGPGKGRGRVAFLPGATTFKEIGFTLTQLEFPDLRRIGREGICAAFGVDPMILGLASTSRGSSMSGSEHEEARAKLWTHTIIPIMRRWEAYLNMFLAPEFGNVRYRFDTSEITALAENRNDSFKRAEQMVKVGTYTPQEIRMETGHDLEPADDQPNVMKVLGVVAAPKETVFDDIEVEELEPVVAPGSVPDPDDDDE